MTRASQHPTSFASRPLCRILRLFLLCIPDSVDEEPPCPFKEIAGIAYSKDQGRRRAREEGHDQVLTLPAKCALPGEAVGLCAASFVGLTSEILTACKISSCPDIFHRLAGRSPFHLSAFIDLRFV